MSPVLDLAFVDLAEHVLSDYSHEDRYMWLRDQLAQRIQDEADSFLDEIGQPSIYEAEPRGFRLVDPDTAVRRWGEL